MGIYLPNMEMPKGADEYRLIIRANGQVIIDKKTYWEEAEAVPVPPHGRLIDADAIRFGDNVVLGDIGNIMHRIHLCEGNYKDLAELMLEKIENAPTIIPAEPSKEES